MKNKTTSIILNKQRDVTLSPYIVTNKIKPTFIICPGGAYRNCDENEGRPVAKALNDLGYNAFILRYSVGKNYKWPYPLEDYESAAEYLISHAKELYVDTKHIVVAGFSAGGHVAGSAACIAKNKPFAAILCYGLSARETLKFCAPNAPDIADIVNENTCPCFIASSRNDWIVPITNTTTLLDSFEKNFVDYEAHIYGYALHGFGSGDVPDRAKYLFCGRVSHWVKDSISWLNELIDGKYISIKENAQYTDMAAVFSCRLIVMYRLFPHILSLSPSLQCYSCGVPIPFVR